ncbi:MULTISPECIES: zinc ribbon domain-containing protein [unclassified Aeromicrobium]|uniref:zinc ribbon domain-containing protein n=1 Tax=unclassified Aeromicrobium TaxID=2633570 RepID=UPI0006FA62D2|nr:MULTISPECIES: zinc ribbon domain-containing protein [unclassified Aeromicrobium]KQP25972.1 hypothetical protein ASF38_09855 [Aeromicrobium sp. Leaf272]KQP78967.1 hypothetical protein ASF37_10820 [Aeromicrobium sp. Leaf289]KQP84676.1 hypothetical protein ASF35_07315 [Aeromicrobium sp. Leaf291]
MSTRVDTEDIASTRSERVLAVVLVVFLLIGSGWFYVKIDDWVGGSRAWEYTAAEQRSIDAAETAEDRAWRAEEERDTALTDLELARENLSLAIEQDQPTESLSETFEEAQTEYAEARAEATTARSRADAAQQAADDARETYDDRARGKDGRYWIVALLRLLFVGALVGGSLRLITVQRARESRYLTLGLSAVAASTLTAVWFAGDYITDYIDVLELGPLVLSVLGAGATVVAFVALQRYLARRVPRSRVRKGECPFCGFPVRGDGPHCEGCGREVVGECGACSSPRRVGSPHCAVCGHD